LKSGEEEAQEMSLRVVFWPLLVAAWTFFENNAMTPSSLLAGQATGGEAQAEISRAAEQITRELAAKVGESQRGRIERGVRQVASLWRSEDGDARAFATFFREHFVADPAELDALFEHCQAAFEQIDGHINEIGREIRRWTDLDLGPIRPIDQLFSALDPGAHLPDDLFKQKIAFVVLANFPLTTLEERLRDGTRWTRRQWAEARLAQRFSKRVPASVLQASTEAQAAGETYISEYNLWMHHVLDESGKRLFPKGMRLISHWNLRDELKANYADPEGLAKQRLIAKAMERIVTQTIPQVAINNPAVDWLPDTNEVRAAPPETIEASAPVPAGGAPPGVAAKLDSAREPDTRYAHLLATFRAARLADAYSPSAPTLIARRFEEDRELPEGRVEQLFKEILTSPLVKKVAGRIEGRLGRKLEPFDIWYDGFLERSRYPQAELDAMVRKKYPSSEAYASEMPSLLEQLGFTKERARYLSERIVVDPSRGAGHAMPAQRRGDKPHLRTRIEKNGMNYKGFNIAVHEMGHNVEQVFSLYNVDYTLLSGVPNNAFTEALAFVFQARDLELLGLSKPSPESERLSVLNKFWMTYEICGPALLDMSVWRWMYSNPEATPAALREATIKIAKDLWNEYYAPVFGAREVVLLAIYSHMVNLFMYLPDYPIGHLIEFQIEEHLKGGKSLGEEFERMATFGRVTPDFWMVHATGKGISAQPLLEAVAGTLEN
jgi:hypothetical protein